MVHGIKKIFRAAVGVLFYHFTSNLENNAGNSKSKNLVPYYLTRDL